MKYFNSKLKVFEPKLSLLEKMEIKFKIHSKANYLGNIRNEGKRKASIKWVHKRFIFNENFWQGQVIRFEQTEKMEVDENESKIQIFCFIPWMISSDEIISVIYFSSMIGIFLEHKDS